MTQFYVERQVKRFEPFGISPAGPPNYACRELLYEEFETHNLQPYSWVVIPRTNETAVEQALRLKSEDPSREYGWTDAIGNLHILDSDDPDFQVQEPSEPTWRQRWGFKEGPLPLVSEVALMALEKCSNQAVLLCQIWALLKNNTNRDSIFYHLIHDEMNNVLLQVKNATSELYGSGLLIGGNNRDAEIAHAGLFCQAITSNRRKELATKILEVTLSHRYGFEWHDFAFDN